MYAIRSYYDTTPDESGAVVTRVEPASPADEAGLKRDDIVFKAKRQMGDEALDLVDVNQDYGDVV